MIKILWQNSRTQRYYYLRLSEDNQYVDFGSANLAAGGPHLHPSEILRLLSTGNGQNRWSQEISGPEARQKAVSYMASRKKARDKLLLEPGDSNGQ